MLFMSCVCHALASVHCCLVVTCLERADHLAPVCDVYCDFVTFPFGILGKVWYLIVSIPDLCCLTYFETWTNYIEEIYIEHMKSFDENNLRDFIDLFIAEKQRQADGAYSSDFSLAQLSQLTRDIFGAGAETTAILLLSGGGGGGGGSSLG